MIGIPCPCGTDRSGGTLIPAGQPATGMASREEKRFAQCCGRYLEKGENPRTVSQLMRSRYSAFALGGYGEYLLATWHPSAAGTIAAAELSIPDIEWVNLVVLRSAQRANAGIVEFIASFKNDAGSIEIHHETSSFLRERGRWLYVKGKIYDA